MNTMTTRVGFPEAERARAAAIYYEGFRRKFAPIMGEDGRGTAVLRAALNPECAISALSEGRLLGIAGLHREGKAMIDIQPENMTRAFGIVGGWLRLLPMLIFARAPKSDELLLDGIAVATDARGMGVGTQLLKAVGQFATDHQYSRIVLDVVDTNPRARHLYEREGFTAMDTHHFPYLRGMFGFSAVTRMVKQVG